MLRVCVCVWWLGQSDSVNLSFALHHQCPNYPVCWPTHTKRPMIELNCIRHDAFASNGKEVENLSLTQMWGRVANHEVSIRFISMIEVWKFNFYAIGTIWFQYWESEKQKLDDRLFRSLSIPVFFWLIYLIYIYPYLSIHLLMCCVVLIWLALANVNVPESTSAYQFSR